MLFYNPNVLLFQKSFWIFLLFEKKEDRQNTALLQNYGLALQYQTISVIQERSILETVHKIIDLYGVLHCV